MITVVLADDHPVVRAGLRALLEQEPDLRILAEASTPQEATHLAETTAPDLVLMDLQFGGTLTGVDATRSIRALPDPPPVLILTNYDTDADILGAVEAGACGYLLKDAPPVELLAAVRAAAAGESALAPGITTRLLDRLRSPAASLSAREIEVVTLVSHGSSNGEIAAGLRISEATVKSHLVHVFTKLGVTSRTAAVAAARRQGIVR
ncbi:response regulator [Actinotalea sp.]|uniref:response regulator n=1 Tax=Actinotalea sp. TaxID=1872145 RepID=UPI003568B66B